MRGLTIAITLLLAPAAPVTADDTTQPPVIVALTATQHPDGWVELHDDVGFFSVAITNTGGAGEVRAVARLDERAATTRVTICETDMSSGNCLTLPVAQLSFDVEPGDQRSFAVFIRLLEPGDIAVLPKITVSFLNPAGALLGAVETAEPDAPQMPLSRPGWLIALLLISLVYGVIMIVYRAFYPSANRVSPD